VPFVQTADDARRAVAATRYPPAGIRGVSVAQRNNRFGTVADYFRDIDAQITVLVQIESRAGLEAAAEIAAVDGVDGVFVGPSDLAAALGHLGKPAKRACRRRSRRSSRRQVGRQAAGILTPVEADARRYLAMGATFVAVGSDLGVFRSATQQLRDRYARSG
jgi:2-dehydro-3-deoxyglucarate aldolase